MDRNLTVLIAEDNEDDAFLLERAFRSIGLKNPIQIVADGEQVIAYLQGADKFADRQNYPFPSVVFLDLKMPRKDGFDVLEWLRDHPECHVMPTMIFSSSSDPADITRAYQFGANAYLVKPGSMPELEVFLKRAFDFWATCAKPPLPQSCG